MNALEPWQLIRLKKQYGGLYVVQHENKIYACRQPTWQELIAQHDIKELYDLTIPQVLVELQKQTLVFPENVEEVPDGQFEALAEAIVDDVPFTDEEVDQILNNILEDANLYRQIALELWQQIGGGTAHDIYNRPIKEVLEMYQTMKFLTQQMEKQNPPQGQQTNVQQNNFAPNEQYIKTKPVVQTNNPPIDYTKFLGKPIDEVLKEMAKREESQ